jgi:hypothetical protein
MKITRQLRLDALAADGTAPIRLIMQNAMSEIAKALVFRLFSTRRLAIESSLWLASIALVLYTLPSVMLFMLNVLFLYGALVWTLTVLGLYLFILPGLFIAAVGLGLGYLLVKLFVRGYLNVGIRGFNWLYSAYSLAREDVALNALFANPDACEASDATTNEPELD